MWCDSLLRNTTSSAITITAATVIITTATVIITTAMAIETPTAVAVTSVDGATEQL